MTNRRWVQTGLAFWALCVPCGATMAQNAKQTVRETPSVASEPLPLDQVALASRAKIQAVLDAPTLRTRGPVESFTCQPPVYDWLLDHPDLALRIWRLLGAKCSDIQPDGADRFVWRENGSVVHWDTVFKRSGMRIWYAEGEVKPGLLLPAVPVRAVAVLRYRETRDGSGRLAIRHQVELTLRTDNHTAALATRLLGASSPHMAEDYVGQLEMFYAALAWYLDRHPKQADDLYAQLKRPASTDVPMARPSSRNSARIEP